MITLKIKIKGLGEKKSMRTFMTDEVQRVKRHKYVYEHFIIRIVTFCCLKMFSSFFNPSMRFYRKTRLIFTYYNVRIHPLPIKPPLFSQILVSTKNPDMFLWRVIWIKIAKNRLISYFCVYLFALQNWLILLKTNSEKKRF